MISPYYDSHVRYISLVTPTVCCLVLVCPVATDVTSLDCAQEGRDVITYGNTESHRITELLNGKSFWRLLPFLMPT